MTTSTEKDGLKAWIVCVAGSLIYSMVGGATYSYGLLLVPFAEHFNESLSLISFGGSSLNIIQFLFSIVITTLSTKYGYQRALICGCILASVAFTVSSFAPNAWAFVLCHGVVAGFAFGLLNTNCVIIINHHFEKKLSTAYGIYCAASSFGTLVLSLVLNWMLESIGLMYIPFMFGCLFGLLVVAASVMKPQKETDTATTDREPAQSALKTALDCCKRPEGYLFLTSIFLFYVSAITVITYSVEMVDKTLNQPMTHAQRGYILPLYGIANGIGRATSGVITDYFQLPPQVLATAGLLGASIGALAMTFFSDLYLLLASLGLTFLSMSAFSILLPSSLVYLFGKENLPPSYGVAGLMVGLAHIPGPPIAGWVYETVGNYRIVGYGIALCFILSSGLNCLSFF